MILCLSDWKDLIIFLFYPNNNKANNDNCDNDAANSLIPQ